MLRNNYNLLPFIAMLWISIAITCPVLAGKHATTFLGPTAVSVFLSPIFWLMQDIVAEVYGYKLARQIFFLDFICEFFMAIIFNLAANLQAPFFVDNGAYYYIFKKFILITTVGGLAAYVAWWTNTRLLMYWKVLTQGRYFLIRSVSASTLGIILFSLILLPTWVWFGRTKNFSEECFIFLSGSLIKISCLAIFAIPATLLMEFLKICENKANSQNKKIFIKLSLPNK